ncbi:MAG: hypothetical protein HYU34_05835 [Candidatus Omnitrophica bacterium]|nr:hypothetical protein [Candidatus Omnitrophota bacterium]
MKLKSVFSLALGLFLLGGCAHAPLLPIHDEVLVFSLPYDLTFLRVLEAADTHPDWEPNWTDKEKGVIHLQNTRYSSFADADKRSMVLLVKREDEGGSSVRLAPESQAVVGGGEVLKLIQAALSEEASLR